jgi:hypothetical protein
VPPELALKLTVCPAQSVELLAAVGAAGIEFMVTLIVPGALTHPFTVVLTE